jgi:hypothetical protein
MKETAITTAERSASPRYREALVTIGGFIMALPGLLDFFRAIAFRDKAGDVAETIRGWTFSFVFVSPFLCLLSFVVAMICAVWFIRRRRALIGLAALSWFCAGIWYAHAAYSLLSFLAGMGEWSREGR